MEILPTFQDNILLYGRLVDHIRCASDMSAKQSLKKFDMYLKSRCKLRCVTSQPSQSINFLDLHVWIEDGRLWASTYQKEINKFPYIPGNSAHLAGFVKGLICGLMK